jgi:hypothetical protein
MAVPVANQAARLTLTVQQARGNTVVQEDDDSSWMLVSGGDPATEEDWIRVGASQDAITRTAAQGSPQGSDTLTLAGPVGLSGGTVALVQTSDKQWEEGGNWLVAYDVDRWMISGPSYGAQKVSVAESPAGLTDWNVTTGSGQPTLEESVTVPATYLGQQCLVGDTPATREIYIALGTGASTVWAKLPKSGEVPHL